MQTGQSQILKVLESIPYRKISPLKETVQIKDINVRNVVSECVLCIIYGMYDTKFNRVNSAQSVLNGPGGE